MYNNKKFTEECNNVLNNTAETARKDGLDTIYSLTFVKVMYEAEDTRDLVERTTGVGYDEFMEKYYKIIEANKHNDDVGELSIQADSHNEFLDVIKYASDAAGNAGTRIDSSRLFRALMVRKTYARSMFIELGVDRARLDQLAPIELDFPIFGRFCKNMNIYSFSPFANRVVNREKDVNKLIETLGRRNKSNAILIGDAGVGKSAIVELLAYRLARNIDIPKYLEGKIICEVDLSAMVGGSQYRGMFEERFNMLLESADMARNVILFFDEFHTVMKAGGSSGNDMAASNILKPALARHTFPVIGATTTKEYNKYIESDEALARRLEVIMVDEPSDTDTIEIVRGVIKDYEEYHNISIPDNVIEYAVKLTSKFMSDKKQPDKSLTVIDQTCAHIRAAEKPEERDSVDSVKTIKPDDIRDTVSRITGIEISDLSMDDMEKLAKLEDNLKSVVIGQDEAIKSVSNAIKRNKMGFSDHDKPIGTFLFVGPTGVGKTELCKQLSHIFSGRNNNLVRVDMTEYMEKHAVSKLIGAPPGYIGHDNGGQLTDEIRRNPYSVVLFDEIEKAHPDVFNILLQVLDDGRLTDSHGRVVDFRNTIIIMTSNAGYGIDLDRSAVGFAAGETKERVSEENAKKALQNTFRPEFLNRLDKIVVFNSLDREDSTKIVGLILNKLKERCKENGLDVEFDSTVIEDIIEHGFDKKFGARNLKRYIQNTLETEITDKFIEGRLKKNRKYVVSIEGDLIKFEDVGVRKVINKHVENTLNMLKSMSTAQDNI